MRSHPVWVFEKWTPLQRPSYRWLRFIPACAGNTLGKEFDGFRVAVHPRLCGEHSSIIASPCSCNGSSPPVRGTPSHCLEARQRPRFIPACAGNTLMFDAHGSLLTVHPRLCGEHANLIEA